MGVRADVETLAAKQAITEVLYQYCRAMDRMDTELAQQCYHPDAVDQHSSQYSGLGVNWIDPVNQIHAGMKATRHVLSNILIEIDGDDAWSESYWTITMRIPNAAKDREFDIYGGGRYIDHFKCVDGVWAIQRRRTINDWYRGDEFDLNVIFIDKKPYITLDPKLPKFDPKRDRADPSYEFLGGHRTDFSAE